MAFWSFIELLARRIDRFQGERDAALEVETELESAAGAAQEFGEKNIVTLLDVLQ
jgi:hypothetical protein